MYRVYTQYTTYIHYIHTLHTYTIYIHYIHYIHTLHAYTTYTAYIHYTTYTTYIHYIHTLHTYTIYIHYINYIHTLHAYTTYIHYIHTLHTYTIYIHYIHTLHTYTIYIHYIHTLHAYTTCIHCIHTLYTYTVYRLCIGVYRIPYPVSCSVISNITHSQDGHSTITHSLVNKDTNPHWLLLNLCQSHTVSIIHQSVGHLLNSVTRPPYARQFMALCHSSHRTKEGYNPLCRKLTCFIPMTIVQTFNSPPWWNIYRDSSLVDYTLPTRPEPMWQKMFNLPSTAPFSPWTSRRHSACGRRGAIQPVDVEAPFSPWTLRRKAQLDSWKDHS